MFPYCSIASWCNSQLTCPPLGCTARYLCQIYLASIVLQSSRIFLDFQNAFFLTFSISNSSHHLWLLCLTSHLSSQFTPQDISTAQDVIVSQVILSSMLLCLKILSSLSTALNHPVNITNFLKCKVWNTILIHIRRWQPKFQSW